MRDEIKAILRDAMNKSVQKTKDETPLKNTPFESLSIKNTLVSSNKYYKKALKGQLIATGMSENDMNKIVDEVTQEMQKKYLK